MLRATYKALRLHNPSSWRGRDSMAKTTIYVL